MTEAASAEAVMKAGGLVSAIGGEPGKSNPLETGTVLASAPDLRSAVAADGLLNWLTGASR